MPDTTQVLVFIYQVIGDEVMLVSTFLGAIGILAFVLLRIKGILSKWTS